VRESSQTGLNAEAIACLVNTHSDVALDFMELEGYTSLASAVKVVRELRNLDPTCAMSDGRKWNSIPFVLIMSSSEFNDYIISEPIEAILTVLHRDPKVNLEEIRQAVSEYRARLLDELDNLGLLVRYHHGRYRVGPALTPRDRHVEGQLYYGPADERSGVRGKYFTIDRDVLGIQYEIDLFEALINDPQVTELDIQRFFEENPHFLISVRLMQVLPQVRLMDKDGKVLIPDFILKPIVAVQRLRDSNWEILDLKHPQAKLLAGPSDHKRFSQEVMQAITQVKDYRDHFEDPTNSAMVENVLGHRLKHPRLGVLIGRMPASADVELLERAQAREPQVRIVTYDEILESQKKLLS